MRRLLIATTNPGKLLEIGPMLEGLGIDLRTLADYPRIDPPEESGATFAANARLKASYYSGLADELTVAEDSGLEIDALNGAPGVESARFGGADTSYAHKFALIYDALSQHPAARLDARFVCALALARGSEIIFEVRGTIEGLIAKEPKGEGGFGYDPIFFYPPFGCTLAESGARKSTVSHRAHAFRELRTFLQTRP